MHVRMNDHCSPAAVLEPPEIPVDPEVPVDVLPVDDTELVEESEHSSLGLVELMLKSPPALDRLINHDQDRQVQLVPRFLGIALFSYTIFTVAMLVILHSAGPEAYPHSFLAIPAARIWDGSALGLVGAYTLGLVGATCICLPSFYFFSLLAGVRLTMLQVVAQVLRCKASSALVLIGILPIYVAVVMGLIVFRAPAEVLEYALYLGLVLPFVAGLEGVRAIYRGVLGMAETLPPERRCRRECFLRRLTVSWALTYTAVSPVLIYRLWELFARAFV